MPAPRCLHKLTSFIIQGLVVSSMLISSSIWPGKCIFLSSFIQYWSIGGFALAVFVTSISPYVVFNDSELFYVIILLEYVQEVHPEESVVVNCTNLE